MMRRMLCVLSAVLTLIVLRAYPAAAAEKYADDAFAQRLQEALLYRAGAGGDETFEALGLADSLEGFAAEWAMMEEFVEADFSDAVSDYVFAYYDGLMMTADAGECGDEALRRKSLFAGYLAYYGALDELSERFDLEVPDEDLEALEMMDAAFDRILSWTEEPDEPEDTEPDEQKGPGTEITGTDDQPVPGEPDPMTGEFVEEGDYKAEILEDGTVCIIKYAGAKKAVEIPETVGRRTVTEIGAKVFQYCSFTDLVIPESVRRIGESAFEYGEFMGSLTLPENVEIGKNAFASAVFPETLVLPAGCVLGTESFAYGEGFTALSVSDGAIVGYRAFEYVESLETLRLGAGVTIGERAFGYAESLKIIEAYEESSGEGETVIGKQAFQYCEDLETLDFPETLAQIGERAFEYCETIRSITLPAGVVIERGAFSYAKFDADLVVPEGSAVGPYAFSYAKGIRSITVEKGAVLSNNAFHYAEDVKAVSVGEEVSVGSKAFYSCTDVETVEIGGGSTVDEQAFGFCMGLTDAEIAEDAEVHKDAFYGTTIQ